MTAEQLDLMPPDVRASLVTTRSLLGLMAADPQNLSHLREICRVIDAAVKPGEFFSANTIRADLPRWIRPQVIGPAFRLLRNRGVIELAGFEVSTDAATHAKAVGRYRLVSTAHSSGA